MDITVGTIDGGIINDSNVGHSSSAPQALASNMTSHSVAKDHSTESHTHSDQVCDSFIPRNCAPVDGAAEHDTSDHEALAYQVPTSQVHTYQVPSYSPFVDYVVNDQKIGKDTPELYIAVDDAHDQGKPDTYMGIDNVVGNSPLCPITFPDTPLDNQFPKIEASEGMVPAKEMHKFMKFPTELRLMIWEMAIADAKEPDHRLFNGCVQRFRFNLAYDAQRVKPDQDKSWGWVACFTPIRINTKKPLIFLRASLDSRTIMLRKMSFLTVHELPIDRNGQYMAPRKLHVPFNFAKDEFCVEGITHGLEEAKKHKEDKHAVWNPTELPLAHLLDNALGLRFAPRIKRLAIMPHCLDVQYMFHGSFIQTANGGNMAALAKRFPALLSVRTAIPRKSMYGEGGLSSGFPEYILWKAASLRGKGLGGPSRMSEQDRDALYVRAWRRIFDHQYVVFARYLTPELFDGHGCLV